MQQAKLESLQRGTPDLPFAWYHFLYGAHKILAPTHWHPEQEILYMRRGALRVMVGKYIYTLQEGDICFVAPNALHNVTTAIVPTEYEAFVFSYDLFALPSGHFFQNAIAGPLREGILSFPVVLRKDEPLYREVSAAIDRLCVRQNDNLHYKLTIFTNLISIYATLADRLSPISDSNSIDNQAVKSCLAYIEAHYHEKITLKQLAQLVHLHPNYLCNLFRGYTGQTAFQVLNRVRLDHAADKLCNENCTVAQAANQCGFDSISFFSRKFTQVMGMSPKTYRQKHRKNF